MPPSLRALALLIAPLLYSQEAPPHLTDPSGDIFVGDSILIGSNAFPYRHWDGPYLLAFTNLSSAKSASIRLYDRTGRNVRSATVWFDGSAEVSIGRAAVTRQGALYAIGHSTSRQGQVSFYVAEIGSDDKVARVIRTNPYVPSYLCSTGDGTVWTFGFERVAGDTAPTTIPCCAISASATACWSQFSKRAN
jgi:hypothetical protein